jgi:hypothetical protein
MNRSRRVAIPLVLAAFVVSALLASSASATTPQWIVEGKALAVGATEEIASTTTVSETFSFQLTVAGVLFKTECKTMTLPKSFIKGESTREDKSFEMGNCSLAAGPKTCSVPATMALEPLTSTLEGTAGSFKLKFAPKEGTKVMTLVFSGAECPIAGNHEVTGTMSCNYPGVETEQKNHVLEFSLTSGTELKTGGAKVLLTGKDEFWLVTNKKWKVA